MDKILSADEFFRKNYSSHYNVINHRVCYTSDCYDAMQAYSTYLLEAFAGDVKSKGEVDLTTTFAKVDKTTPTAFAEWTQLKGWGLLGKNKWINKNSEVVSSEVLFYMYYNEAE